VVKAQAVGRELAEVQLDAHIGPAEQRGGECHERRERHQKYVERVDEEHFVPQQHRSVADYAHGECRRRHKSEKAHARVELRSGIAMPAERQQDATGERYAKHEQKLHHRSFSFSRWWMSRLSNLSRMWKKNTPNIRVPTRTSSAMP